MQGNYHSITSPYSLQCALEAVTKEYEEYGYAQLQLISGKNITQAQKAYIHVLYAEAAKKTQGETAYTIKLDCKLNLGITLLHAEDPVFREKWNRTIKGNLNHEELLGIMDWFPVIESMDIEQASRYIDSILHTYNLEDRR